MISAEQYAQDIRQKYKTAITNVDRKWKRTIFSETASLLATLLNQIVFDANSKQLGLSMGKNFQLNDQRLRGILSVYLNEKIVHMNVLTLPIMNVVNSGVFGYRADNDVLRVKVGVMGGESKSSFENIITAIGVLGLSYALKLPEGEDFPPNLLD